MTCVGPLLRARSLSLPSSTLGFQLALRRYPWQLRQPALPLLAAGTATGTPVLAASQRAMERPKPGASFFTSCVTLCKTIIGSGLLGLPFALAQTGLVLGVALLLLAAAAQGFALHLFALCAIHQRRVGPTGADPPSFHSLAQNARLPPAFVESAVGLATFGARCSFAAAITRHQACGCKCLNVLWPVLSCSAFRQPHCAGAGVTGFATSYLIVMGGKRFD
eukprot:COSAG01_NODE_4066_length_5385_cov_159.277336_9_plen_221_part_00